jgi:ribosomal protein S18 acetylase RimI-like enzyme
VDADNDGAQRLYERSGFTESRREIILRKSLDGREHPSLYRDQRPD